jgi:hypothetical protein
MIDWPGLLASSAWIVGLALLLAAFSLAYYRAREEGSGLRHALRAPGLRRVLNAGLTLFCMGLLAASHALWEQVAWGLLATFFWVRALTVGQRRRRATETDMRVEGREG